MASKECSSNPKNGKATTKGCCDSFMGQVYCTIGQRQIQSVKRGVKDGL